MEWDYLKMFGVVGIMTFGILLFTIVWDNWLDVAWHGLKMPVTIKQILIEWAIYMFVFVLLSLAMQGMLHLACSVC